MKIPRITILNFQYRTSIQNWLNISNNLTITYLNHVATSRKVKIANIIFKRMTEERTIHLLYSEYLFGNIHTISTSIAYCRPYGKGNRNLVVWLILVQRSRSFSQVCLPVASTLTRSVKWKVSPFNNIPSQCH